MGKLDNIKNRLQSFFLYNLLLFANFTLLLSFAYKIQQETFFIKVVLLLASYCLVGLAGYLINDLFDKKSDFKANKFNLTQYLNSYQVVFIVFILFMTGYLLVKQTSILASYLIFLQLCLLIVYSIPKVRMKERGFLGVTIDACYAHLIPEIILLLIISQYTLIHISWTIIFLSFSFCIGLRDILIHQILDAKNDSISGVQTFAKNHLELAGKIVLYLNIVGPVLILLLLGLISAEQKQGDWSIYSILLAISYLHVYKSTKNEIKFNQDIVIQHYIIVTSFLFIFLIYKNETYWLFLLLAHPYFISFMVNKILNNARLALKYLIKIVLGKVILTLIPIFLNNILYFTFKFFGRDLKSKPLYKRENEFILLKKIRSFFN